MKKGISMSLFTTPSFVNLGIINGVGVVVFLILTVLSAWTAAKSKGNTNPWWAALLMSVTSIALTGYNGYNAYLAYDGASGNNIPWALIAVYGVLALIFFSMIFGVFSTTKEKKPETSPVPQY